MDREILNYRIERLLGEGGMSRVYLGVDPVTGQKVAIKELLPHLAEYDEMRLRLRQEAQLLARLSHPNIVRLIRYEEAGSRLVLVQEYIDGMDLEEYISGHRGPIPEAEAKELFCRLLEAVGYAHAHQVIHRDIKPANIIMTEEKELKVLDFGIAKISGGGSGLLHTKTGTRIGTVVYMSPEQVNGEELDVRTDIYSLGVVLHQMLTGKAPYEMTTGREFQIQTKIVNEPLPRMKGIYEYVSEGMQAVVDKATAKDRQRRYRSCEEFRNAILRQEGEKAWSPSRGDKWVIVVAALVAIVMFGFGLMEGLMEGMEGVGGSTPASTSSAPAPAAPASKTEKRIGEEYQGGVIFYLLQPGDSGYDENQQHGLIAAKEDIVKSYTDQWEPSWNPEGVYFRWSTGEHENTGAGDYAYGELGTGTAIGTGRRNTEKILKRYPARAYPNSAAAVARSYRGGGYSDWFLPSKDELNELYRQKVAVGGFVDYVYWSSSEGGSDDAWIQLFVNGDQYYYGGKIYGNRVRVVRAF